MGLDGLALDEDDDALREMRLNAFLHRGWGYEDRIDEAAWWRFAAVHGRLSILGAAGDESLPAGVLQAGAAADFMVLDRRRLDEEGALVPGVDPWALVLARGCARHIDSVVAQGRCVVQDGRVTGVDEAMLVAQFREQVRAGLAAQGGWAQWGADVRALAEDLGPFYRKGAWLGCC
jgi:cytosine/adenosine deaminase-related metal-dependent hydrolase